MCGYIIYRWIFNVLIEKGICAKDFRMVVLNFGVDKLEQLLV